jgi:hypothetical protein
MLLEELKVSIIVNALVASTTNKPLTLSAAAAIPNIQHRQRLYMSE